MKRIKNILKIIVVLMLFVSCQKETPQKVVEKTVLTLINRRQIRPESCSDQTDQGCQLSTEARKLLLNALVDNFSCPLPKNTNTNTHASNLFQALRFQIRSLKSYVLDSSEFKAWRN